MEAPALLTEAAKPKSRRIQDVDRRFRPRFRPRIELPLESRDVDAPPDSDLSYRAIAKRFGIREPDVTDHLFRGRRRLRDLVPGRIRDTVSGTGGTEEEMRLLFGRKC